MKHTSIAIVALLGASAPVLADDDTKFKQKNRLDRLGSELGASFSQDEMTKQWVPISSSVVDGKARCSATLAELAELGTPGTSKVKLDNDVAEFKKGEYTVDAMLPLCERVVAFAKTKNWQRHAENAFYEYPKVGPKTPYNVKHFENCIKEYDAMMKAGVPPTYVVPLQGVADASGKMVSWGGTVEEVRTKWCDDGLKKGKEERERRDAPYKKALTGDKLKLALSWRAMYLPGGALTEDPAKMAAVNVWFTDAYPGKVCLTRGVPDVHVLTRYEFDGASKMIRSTSTEYCGSPPSSAFR